MNTCKDCGAEMVVICGTGGVSLLRCENCGRVVNNRTKQAFSKQYFERHGDENLRESIGMGGVR